jgi:ABC-type transport system involved in multi-copper enzyme maturation permease subunit
VTTLLLVELEKLRTVRSAWLLFAAGALLPFPIVLVALVPASDPASTVQDTLYVIALPVLFAGALAAVACAREFEHRTIAVAFMLEPRRERVIAAKAAAAALVALAMAALASMLTLGTVAVWISAEGGAWPWSGGETAQAVCGGLLLTVVSAICGTGFGALIRHVGGAITVMFALALVVESLLASQVELWREYGAGAASQALVERVPPYGYGFLGGAGVVVAGGLLLLAAGIAVVRRTDV